MSAGRSYTHLDCEACGAWSGKPHRYPCARTWERDEAVDLFRGLLVAGAVAALMWAVTAVLVLLAGAL